MIDMKQIKENVSSKIKNYQSQDVVEAPLREKTKVNENPARSSNMAAIGASIRIKGEVTGDENLIIQGQVEGTITVQGHNVTISKGGKVRANIIANQIIVEGELEGDMNGDEKVVIRETGNVRGNIIAPRVTLEDGAMFKGSIEMEPRNKSTFTNKPSSSTVPNKDSTELRMA
jgi:cytoskeletal protein CcmA (bactofilin family)